MNGEDTRTSYWFVLGTLWATIGLIAFIMLVDAVADEQLKARIEPLERRTP